jgi:two-component system response regulator QseB
LARIHWHISMMRLLLVEDNVALGDMLSAYLCEHGFTVDTARTGQQALQASTRARYDAVILDLGLPDMDGMDVLHCLRQTGTLPTLILTARDSVAHRVAGLNGGADDYILKPFDLTEFEARLRAVLRRPGSRAVPLATFADLAFDPACRAARVGVHEVELTRREATLLEALLQAGDRIVVRDALADALYGVDDDVSGNALEATVSRLRRKMALLGSAVRIETVRGIGYRLKRDADTTL